MKMPKSIEDYKDNRIVRILTSNGYTPVLKEIAVEDVVRYDDSQARIGDLDPVYVNRYKNALQNGAVFPPIVVYSNGRDGYICLDGNHRVGGYRKVSGRSTITAYVLKESLTHEEAVYISGVINVSTNGKPVLSKQELERLVLAAAKSRPNIADEKIGQELGVSRTKIRNIRITRKAIERLQDVGFDTNTLNLGDDSIRTLHTKVSDDSVLLEAAELIRDAGLKGDDFKGLLYAVDQAGSEADKLVAVRKIRTAKAAEIENYGTTYIMPVEINNAVAAIYRATQNHPEADRWSPLTPARRGEFLGKVRDVAAFLQKVEAHLAPIVASDAAEQALIQTDAPEAEAVA